MAPVCGAAGGGTRHGVVKDASIQADRVSPILELQRASDLVEIPLDLYERLASISFSREQSAHVGPMADDRGSSSFGKDRE